MSLRLAGVLCAGWLLCAGVAHAEEKPLWEFGLGVGTMLFDDYRGSDETNVYPVPVPYFVYRGDFFKADSEGVRGLLFNRRYAELSMSVNGTIPVSSDDNDARRGMPGLRSTVEIGPSLDLHVFKSADERFKFDIRLPVRAPLTVESSPRTLGWIFAPRFNLDIADVAGYEDWNLGLSVGPMFADRKYHRYFYSVAERHATAERPAYQADGGYSGSHAIISLSKRFPDYWVGAYVRYDSLHGADFAASPLVKRQYSVSAGIGIAWMITQSKIMVDVGKTE